MSFDSKIEYNTNGKVNKYKARIVVKGHNQRKGIYYEDIFPPIAKMITIRVVITRVINNDQG